MSIWLFRISVGAIAVLTAMFLAIYGLALNDVTRGWVSAALTRGGSPVAQAAPLPTHDTADRTPVANPGRQGAEAEIAITLKTLRSSALQYRSADAVKLNYGYEAASLKASGRFDEARALLAKHEDDERIKAAARSDAEKAIATLEKQMFSDPAAADRVLSELEAREMDVQLSAMWRKIRHLKDNPSAEPGRYNSQFGGEAISCWLTAA